jgi:hypothetical protein
MHLRSIFPYHRRAATSTASHGSASALRAICAVIPDPDQMDLPRILSAVTVGVAALPEVIRTEPLQIVAPGFLRDIGAGAARSAG